MPSIRIKISVPDKDELKKNIKSTLEKTAKRAKAAAEKAKAGGVEGVLSRAEDTAVAAVKGVTAFVEDVKYDMDAICDRDPAARSHGEVLLLYSGLHARIFHRASHALYTRGHFFPARLISQGAKFLTGIEIHPGATIGRGLFLDHGSGIVIGETAILGDNCTLYQGVTLGGTGKEAGKRHPTLGDNVMVGAGAKLLGNFTIGDGAKIAAGAVVLRDVPPYATAVGMPARVVRLGGEKLPAEEMDQTHIPDPVALQLAHIEKRLKALEKSGDAPDKAEKAQEEIL